VAILASAGLAIGLALQGSLANFAAGVMILIFRPFDLGDKVTAAGNTGKVNDIGLFATTLVTADNETIITPNSSITSESIINHTTRGTLRGNISVGVAYGANIDQAIQVMEKACRESDLVLEDPAPSVAFVGFGASSIDFVVRPWATSGDYLTMLHNVRVNLYDRLNEAEIEIPFDQIVVHNAA
jgi:small conductance mechanosensitive channel